MAIKKQYSQDKTICKVTLTLPKNIAQQFDTIAVVGDFNHWDAKANHFAAVANGDRVVSIELEANREHQFRYLGNGEVWLNESEAEKTVPSPYGDARNSVIIA